MSDKKVFNLPDLGEGLPDAEIVEWYVKVGDSIQLDEALVSMETAKAVVEVPSPYSGKVSKLAGGPGDVIVTGAMLAEFVLDPNLPQRAEAQDTGHGHGSTPSKGAGAPAPHDGDTMIASDDGGEIAETDAPAPKGEAHTRIETLHEDAGTVVGAMEVSDRVQAERASMVGGVKAMPAVRALAKKLGVDLARVAASGADGAITLADVKKAAEAGTAKLGTTPPSPSGRRAGDEGTARAYSPASPAPPSQPSRPSGAALGRSSAHEPAAHERASSPPAPQGKEASRSDREVRFDIDEPIRGVRRNMMRTMSAAHAEVVPTTLMDDADLHAWAADEDITVRLIRCIVAASRAVPTLNSWLNAKQGTLRRHSRVDIGIAVDTADGLFVPALRNCERLDPQQVRAGVNRIRELVKTRSIPPEELRDYTIMLSNFGVFAGKYATPIVVPPCIAIVGAGRLFDEVVPVMGGLQTHRIMPISLTFDHRAATGGEAARFLHALINDLHRPH